MFDREQWLRARQGGIGSSDAPAILGLSPWQSAWDIYHRKTEPKPVEQSNPALEWGVRLEPVVAAKAADEHGWELVLPDPARITHREYEWIAATPDRYISGGHTPVEIKTASRADGWGDPDTDQIPDHVWVQVQHQLGVIASHDPAVDHAWVCVLIGGNDYRRYHVQRDPDTFASWLPIFCEFWEMVQKRQPPEPDWSQRDILGRIQRQNPPDDGEQITLDDSHAKIADSYEDLCNEIKALTTHRDEAKARLIHAMGTASIGLLPDGRKVVRKMNRRREYTVPATEYQTFSIQKAK